MLHLRGESMRNIDGAHEIDFKHKWPIGRLQFPKWKAVLVGADTSRIHDVIKLIGMLLYVGGELFDRFIICRIQKDTGDFTCHILRHLGCCFCDLGIDVSQYYVGTLFSKFQRDGVTDAFGTSDDQYAVVFEV